MSQYSMTTIERTKIRSDHNTASPVIGEVNPETKVIGFEKFVAIQHLENKGGKYQFAGDVWLKVTLGGVTGWMAYIHKGALICKDFREQGSSSSSSQRFITLSEIVDGVLVHTKFVEVE